jgi:5-methylcytosine-specific restriction endonuclease McrA
VYAYYGQDCIYCGALATGVDHLQPVARGGTNDFYNLAPCCKECNLKKAARPIWVMLGRVA